MRIWELWGDCAQRHGVLTALALLKEHVQPVQGPLKPFQIPQHRRTRHKEVLLFWPASRSPTVANPTSSLMLFCIALSN